jgi:hypothetical protein
MTMLGLAFASPWAGLVALAAVVPLGALAVATRRSERVASALGLRSARDATVFAATLIVVFAALVGAAAAQPVTEKQTDRRVRSDAQAWFVIDTSRSMLAAPSAEGVNRFTRAKREAIALRAQLSDVPSGIASFTDRAVPNLFPSVSQQAFAATALQSLAIERPPPGVSSGTRSTSFDGLAALAYDNYFAAPTSRRLVVVLTDGESRPFSLRRTARAFPRRLYRVVVVHLWHGSERVWRIDGSAEEYLPDRASTTDIGRLARATGGEMFEESALPDAAASAREFLGRGPSRKIGTEQKPVALAPWLLAAALVPLGLLLWRRAL